MSQLAPVAHQVAPAVTTPTAAAQKYQLDKSAKEFAGILIDTLWSEFQNDPLAPSQGQFSDPGAESLKGLGLQAMSGALAQRGGLGLAAMIEHQLQPVPAAAKKVSAEVTLLKSQATNADKLEVARLSQSAMTEKPR
ncbi:MAG: hypothetical protein ACRD04_13210 [Terriglobales bacterium]